MPFFARPDLSNEQFKQLSGSTLTLSGTTRIAKIGGLEFIDEYGTPIPVIITGASDSKVLTYYDGNLILMSGGTGSTGLLYPYVESATTTVGGLCAGQNLYGVQVVDILHDILVPTLCPSLIMPSSTFTISCLPTTSTGFYEVGTYICVTGCSTFCRGCVNPAYCCTLGDGSDKRSGLPSAYSYTYWAGTVNSSASLVCPYTNTFIFMPLSATTATNYSISERTFYSAATNNVLKSDGSCWCSPLPSGCTSAINRSITSMYPYFYGVSDSVPVAGSALLSTGTKCVCLSNGNVPINFNAIDKYLWLAIPSGTTKVRWTGSNSVTNTESIPGGLFSAKSTVSVNSPSSCWSGRNYDFYISNYKTCTCESGTFYTMTFTNS